MASVSRTTVKGPNAFRTISEASDAVGAPQHVLRFWETRFSFLNPVKRAGGRRFYRPQDVVLLKAVRRLLHEEGLTIRGVQRLHKEQGLERLAAYGEPEGSFSMDASVGDRATAQASIGLASFGPLIAELQTVKARLDRTLAH